MDSSFSMDKARIHYQTREFFLNKLNGFSFEKAAVSLCLNQKTPSENFYK